MKFLITGERRRQTTTATTDDNKLLLLFRQTDWRDALQLHRGGPLPSTPLLPLCLCRSSRSITCRMWSECVRARTRVRACRRRASHVTTGPSTTVCMAVWLSCRLTVVFECRVWLSSLRHTPAAERHQELDLSAEPSLSGGSQRVCGRALRGRTGPRPRLGGHRAHRGGHEVRGGGGDDSGRAEGRHQRQTVAVFVAIQVKQTLSFRFESQETALYSHLE